MIYGSVCSGIEAATVAWHPMGWRPEFFSEIEAFPNSVLKHRWPKVPNLGDMNKFKEWKHGPIDLLVGGTPCQSFSVAGLRKGLADPRGNLALTFLAIINRTRPKWVVWENVSGVLSSWSDEEGSFAEEGDGREKGWQSNDFDTFTCALGKLGYGFAYRILDAQFIGVPQRRRRVFVVGHLGDWRRAAAVLFERHSLSWDPPPSGPARERTAPSVAKSLRGRGNASHREDSDTYIPEVSPALKSRDYKGPSSDGDGDGSPLIVSALTARHDSSPDGSGHGTPIIPIQEIGKRTGSGGKGQNGCGIGGKGDPMFTLQAGAQHAIYDMRGNGDGNTSPTLSRSAAGDRPNDFAPMIFSSKDYGADASNISPTLRAGGHDKSHANAGIPPAVAFTQNQGGSVLRTKVCPSMGTNQNATARNTPKVAIGWSEELNASCELAGTIQRGGQGGRHEGVMTPGMQVRRLTPRECERLQGFPDDYTLVPYRGGSAKDGPRYKAIGNSMATVVMKWIGRRIEAVERLK